MRGSTRGRSPDARCCSPGGATRRSRDGCRCRPAAREQARVRSSRRRPLMSSRTRSRRRCEVGPVRSPPAAPWTTGPPISTADRDQPPAANRDQPGRLPATDAASRPLGSPCAPAGWTPSPAPKYAHQVDCLVSSIGHVPLVECEEHYNRSQEALAMVAGVMQFSLWKTRYGLVAGRDDAMPGGGR